MAILHRGEEASDPVLKSVDGVDSVANDRPKRFGCLMNVRFHRFSIAHGDACHARVGSSKEVRHHVEDVCTQYDKVFATCATVFLSPPAQFFRGNEGLVLYPEKRSDTTIRQKEESASDCIRSALTTVYHILSPPQSDTTIRHCKILVYKDLRLTARLMLW